MKTLKESITEVSKGLISTPNLGKGNVQIEVNGKFLLVYPLKRWWKSIEIFDEVWDGMKSEMDKHRIKKVKFMPQRGMDLIIGAVNRNVDYNNSTFYIEHSEYEDIVLCSMNNHLIKNLNLVTDNYVRADSKKYPLNCKNIMVKSDRLYISNTSQLKDIDFRDINNRVHAYSGDIRIEGWSPSNDRGIPQYKIEELVYKQDQKEVIKFLKKLGLKITTDNIPGLYLSNDNGPSYGIEYEYNKKKYKIYRYDD